MKDWDKIKNFVLFYYCFSYSGKKLKSFTAMKLYIYVFSFEYKNRCFFALICLNCNFNCKQIEFIIFTPIIKEKNIRLQISKFKRIHGIYYEKILKIEFLFYLYILLKKYDIIWYIYYLKGFNWNKKKSC